MSMYRTCIYINNCFTCGKAPWICILSFKLVTDWLCRAFLLNMDEIGRVPGGELFSPFGFPPAELFFLLSTPACRLVWVCMYVLTYDFTYVVDYCGVRMYVCVCKCMYVCRLPSTGLSQRRHFACMAEE